MNEQKIVLDISKSTPQAQVVKIGQGDASGTTIKAAIYDNGVAATLTGMSARFCMRTPGGDMYVRDSGCSVNGNEITYVVDESHCASVAGRTDTAYFELVSGGTVIYSTSRFLVIVLRSVEDGSASPAESWDTNFDDWLDGKDAEVAQIETRLIDNVNSAVSDAEDAMQQAISDTEEVIDRAEDAIDAMGDISEQAVPLMSPDTRGGAKLEQHGGLALRDGSLGIGSLVQQSDGYARGGLAQVTAKGHAEQVATTGKNLANPSVFDGYTQSYSVNADGSITVVGSDARAWGNLPTLTLNAGTYTLSRDVTTGSMAIRTSDDSYASDQHVESGASSITFTLASNGGIKVKVGYSASSYPFTIRLQLELGSTATAYEPYTGGLPSPRPDWEQPIEVVRGRNLLDPNTAFPNTFYRVNSDNSITVLANDTNSWSVVPTFPLVAGTYTIQMLDGGNHRLAVRTSDSNYSWDVNNITGSGSFTFKLNNDGGLRMKIGGGTYPQTLRIQLTLGSTPQPYVPYGHVGMEAQGRNLLDFEGWLKSKNAVYARDGEAYTITNVGQLYSSPHVFADTPAEITLSAVVDNLTSSNVRISLGRYENGAFTFPNDGWVTQNTPVKTYVANAMRIDFSSVSSFKISTPMLELGSTPHDYEPYFHTTTPIPLPQRGWVAGLRDGTADSLRLDGAGKCEWTLPTSEVVLDGSEDWTHNNTVQQIAQYQVDIHGISEPESTTSNRIRLVASRYIAVLWNGSWYKDNVIVMNLDHAGTGRGIRIMTSAQATLADFKTWLSTHNVTVLFPLATPVTEDCGYVDMPEISGECQVSIPELDALGIKYFVDDTVTQYGREIYARVRSEYADRITALEQAVAELATS